MLKTYLYIPEGLVKKIDNTAKIQKRSKAAVMRQALESGIGHISRQSNASVEVLFKIAELGRKFNVKGPKDSSENMDEYLWDKDWSGNEK